MKNRKYFPNRSVIFITTRVEEGLPLTPTYLNNLIFKGILARAQTLFPVRLCHYIFMGNHLHLIVIVKSAEDLSSFMGYVKGEISHSVNRLLGRRQKTIWQDSYDSPPLLMTQDLIRYIKYIYLNPIRANLTATIQEYPGLSSWEMFNGRNQREFCTHVRRTAVPRLRVPELSINEQRRMAGQLAAKCEQQHELVLEPFACFAEMQDYDGSSDAEVRERLLAEFEREARELRAEHAREGKGYIGATALRRQSMLRAHTPEKFGKRMICICSDLEMRKRYIEHFRALAREAALAFQAWKKGIFSRTIPPGMFAPRMPCLASALRPY